MDEGEAGWIEKPGQGLGWEGSEAELGTEAPACSQEPPHIPLLLGLKGLRNVTAASTFWVIGCIFTLVSSFADALLQASPGLVGGGSVPSAPHLEAGGRLVNR